MSQQRILIVLENGLFKGASTENESGRPTPLDLVTLGAVLPDLNAAALAEVARLQALPAEPPADGPPTEVGSGQIRAAMIHLDLAADEDALDAMVMGVIHALPLTAKEKAIAAALWRKASVFRRDHPFIVMFQQATGRSAADMDAIFLAAADF